jgi:hypothetical protein
MSFRNSPTLALDVRTRRAERLAAWLVLIGVGGAAALLGASPWWTPLLAACGVGAVALGLWRAGWIGSSNRVAEVRWPPGELSADTRVFRNAVWLRWTSRVGRRSAMLLARGDVPAGQLRALAVRLRIDAVERALPEARTRSPR